MKLYMVSLGCAKNQVDSEMILGVCKRKMEIVATPDEADLILVNTCAFIEPARVEAIDTILQLSDYKENKAKLIVCGCLPQRYKDEIAKLLPEVDRFISIDEYSKIGEIISSVIDSKYELDDFSFTNRIYSTPSYMRYVKISEGCLNRCAFCAIPLIRGRLKSRTMESIYEEVLMHVNEGVYEINLISQDTTKYGFDLYDNKPMIVELLKKLVAIPGDFKIRLLYLYPDIVTDELIDFIANNPKVMPYFDIPIQHSEDKMLKVMHRRGNREYLLNLFNKIKTKIPHATLRTTLIVGFPYEEESDIDNLIDFINEVKFDRLGAFTFSLEEGTKACEYPNDISESAKQERYERVMAAQQEIILKKNQNLIGTIIEDAFIIDYDEDSYMYVARSDAYAPDEIDGCIYVAAKYELKLGQRIKVKVLDCDEYSLTAEHVE